MRKTMRETREEKREVALAEIRDKVADGLLTIRPMTAEERTRYGLPAARS
jgi:hypothetical protein